MLLFYMLPVVTKFEIPKLAFLNMIPCSLEGEEFFTINSIGTAFCVYRIFNSQQMESYFKKQGYQLVDKWNNEEKRCDVSYFTETEVCYYGWYFRKDRTKVSFT